MVESPEETDSVSRQLRCCLQEGTRWTLQRTLGPDGWSSSTPVLPYPEHVS